MRCEGKHCPAVWSKALLGQRLPSVSISADENRHDSSATRLFRFVSELGTILITTYYYSSGSYSPPPPPAPPLFGCFFCSVYAICCISHQIIPIFIIEKKRRDNSAQLQSFFVLLGAIKMIQNQGGSQRPQSGRYYLCCGSCLRLGPAPILGNRSISLWSCTAHTPGCTLGDGYSSPPPHRSCCWSLGGAPGDKNTPLLSPVLRYTGDCSRLWPRDIDLWREARNVTSVHKHGETSIRRHSMLP